MFYRVAAVMAEELSDKPWPEVSADAKTAYEADHRRDWTGHIVALRSPILTRGDVIEVIRTEKFRIYPPFWLNRKSSITHSFDEVTIPMETSSSLSAFPFQAMRSKVY